MKKNKAYLFFFCFAFLSTSLCAQYCDTFSFQKIYWNQGIHNAHPRNVSINSSGDLFIIGTTESAINKSDDMWILKTTAGGNIIWSKCFGLQKDETLNGLRTTRDGGFLVTGSTKSVSTFEQGWIAKTDTDANVQWSIALGVQYSSLAAIVQLNDGGYAAAGTLYTDFSGDSSGNITDVRKSANIILRLDKNGNLIWFRSFRFSNKEGLKTVSQMKDGSLLTTGSSSDLKAGYILKLDKNNGNIIWMNGYTKYNQYAFPRASEQPDGTIHLHVGNRTFFLTADGKYFEARQIELNSRTLSLSDVQVVDAGHISANTEMYEANLYPRHSPILFAVQDDSVVVWAHQYQQTPDNLQRLINGRIYNNNIYVAGEYITNNLSDNAAGEDLAYLVKANADGSTLCSDTFNVSFKIDVINPPADMITYSPTNEGSLHPFFVSPYTEILSANMRDDCAIQNCCKPVNRDTAVTLCSGTIYKLPPNDSVVRTSGTYSFSYPKFGGCDSVVNYKVHFTKLFTVSLGNDTCLINNQPVTFLMPKDSAVYKWQNGSTTNTFTASFPGKYWVTATSSCNISSDTVNVNAFCSLPVFIPSAFTPNNDGLNDIFKPAQLNGQRLISLSVYNRYGNKIFFSENAGNGWDGTRNGKPQPTGTYIYTIFYFDLGGAVRSIKGTVVLIR